MKNFVYGLLMAVMSLFIVFGLFEAYVRVTQTNVDNFDIEMWLYARDMKRVSDIPRMGHEHVPNQTGTYMGVPITINSVGWRDKEYPMEQSQGTVRIMMLGDSVTLGWGAPPEGITSTVLEDLLNQSEGQTGRRQYEVLNTGIGNTNTTMQTAYFLHEGFRFQPDIVILNYFINDAEPTPTRTDNFLVEHSYAAVFLAGRLDMLMRTYFGRGDWKTYYKNLYGDSQSGWQNTKESLRELVTFSQERNMKLIVVSYPELHQLSPYPFQEVTDLIAEQARSYDVPFVDLLPAVAKEEPRSLWVSSTDAHPNGKAGRLFALELKQALSENFPAYIE